MSLLNRHCCNVIGCSSPDTHNSSYHWCTKCLVFGNQCQCFRKYQTKNINPVISQCNVFLCQIADSHNTIGHRCRFCFKLHSENHCQLKWLVLVKKCPFCTKLTQMVINRSKNQKITQQECDICLNDLQPIFVLNCCHKIICFNCITYLALKELLSKSKSPEVELKIWSNCNNIQTNRLCRWLNLNHKDWIYLL